MSSYLKEEDQTPVFCSQNQYVLKNQYHLHRLYIDTLNDMIHKLYDDLENQKPKCPFQSAQQISKFGEAVKYFFKYDNLLLIYKARSQINQEQQLDIFNTQKYENQEFSNKNAFSKEEEKINQQYSNVELICEKRLLEESEQLERIIASMTRQDANNYAKSQFSQKGQSKMMMMIHDEKLSANSKRQYLKEELMDEQDNRFLNNLLQSQSSDQISQLSNYGERASEMISVYCLGQYHDRNLKRISSKGGIKLRCQMNNVLLKFSDTGREIFYDRALFILDYREKDEELLKYQQKQQ